MAELFLCTLADLPVSFPKSCSQHLLCNKLVSETCCQYQRNLKKSCMMSFTSTQKIFSTSYCVDYLNVQQNRKLGNLGKFSFLKIKQHHFVLDHFILFLDLEFHILPKIEVKENFPRFPTFKFQVQAKTENLETSGNFHFFLLNLILKLQFFV